MRWHKGAKSPTVWKESPSCNMGLTKGCGEPLHCSPACGPGRLSFSAEEKLQGKALSLSPAALGGGLDFLRVKELVMALKFPLFPSCYFLLWQKAKKLHVEQNHGPWFHSEKTQAYIHQSEEILSMFYLLAEGLRCTLRK